MVRRYPERSSHPQVGKPGKRVHGRAVDVASPVAIKTRGRGQPQQPPIEPAKKKMMEKKKKVPPLEKKRPCQAKKPVRKPEPVMEVTLQELEAMGVTEAPLMTEKSRVRLVIILPDKKESKGGKVGKKRPRTEPAASARPSSSTTTMAAVPVPGVREIKLRDPKKTAHHHPDLLLRRSERLVERSDDDLSSEEDDEDVREEEEEEVMMVEEEEGEEGDEDEEAEYDWEEQDNDEALLPHDPLSSDSEATEASHAPSLVNFDPADVSGDEGHHEKEMTTTRSTRAHHNHDDLPQLFNLPLVAVEWKGLRVRQEKMMRGRRPMSIKKHSSGKVGGGYRKRKASGARDGGNVAEGGCSRKGKCRGRAVTAAGDVMEEEEESSSLRRCGKKRRLESHHSPSCGPSRSKRRMVAIA